MDMRFRIVLVGNVRTGSVTRATALTSGASPV